MNIKQYISTFSSSPLSIWNDLEPWEFTSNAIHFIEQLLKVLPKKDFIVTDDIAIHTSATIEKNVTLKKPIIIGPGCFVASGAYLREGCWLEENCVLGPGVELKSSFIFSGSKLAHFNYVGDSILGREVNLEGGSIIANHRNERINKEICVVRDGQTIHTGVTKFGALVGDFCRIGANAVIAPGSLLLPKHILGRLALLDQEVI